MGLAKNWMIFFTNWCICIYVSVVLLDLTGQPIRRVLWDTSRTLLIAVCINGMLILSINGDNISNQYHVSNDKLVNINLMSHLLPIIFAYFYKPKNVIGEPNKRESVSLGLFLYFLYSLFFNTMNIYALDLRQLFLSFSVTFSVFIFVLNVLPSKINVSI